MEKKPHQTNRKVQDRVIWGCFLLPLRGQKEKKEIFKMDNTREETSFLEITLEQIHRTTEAPSHFRSIQ